MVSLGSEGMSIGLLSHRGSRTDRSRRAGALRDDAILGGIKSELLLRHNVIIVNSRTQRDAGAGHLRHPPGFPQQRVLAAHHSMSEIVHEQGSHLGRRIDGTRVRKRPLQGVAFDAISTLYRATRGPRIEGRRSMTCRHQSIPDHPLPAGLVRFRAGGLHRGIQQRLTPWSNGFPPAARSKFCLRRSGHLWSRGVGPGVFRLPCRVRGSGRFQSNRRWVLRRCRGSSGKSSAAKKNKRG